MTEDIAAVVAGLTEAQRAKVLEIGDGQPREYSLGASGFALLRRNLAFVNELGERHLTDSGLRVRASLMGEG